MIKVEGAGYREILKKRPLNVQALYGDEAVGLVSGRDIAEAAKEKGAIVLAANVRNPLTIKGLLRAAKKCSAVVLLELAKSESTYCGCNFDNVPDYALRYSAEMGHGVLFGLHVDHYGIKSREDLLKSISHLRKIIERGWSSVAVDASHNPDWENLCFTRDVAMHVPPYLGLEVEVGEIKGKGELSTVEEALFFVGGLNSWGIFPDYLAISNGSLHGTYDKAAGVEEGIDLARTAEIAKAIAPYGVSIAQHGISGTPFDKVGHFVTAGINKGNVGTLWQNVVFGLKMESETGNAVLDGESYVKEKDRGIPEGLWRELVAWADDQGMSRKSGDYKKANKPFHERIMALPDQVQERIVAETEEWATRYIKAFNAEGLADVLMEKMVRRTDENAAPDRAILNSRREFSREKALGLSQKETKKGDFSD